MIADRTVYLTRTFEHPVERVFSAFATPEVVCRWFGPIGITTTHAEIDFRVGGRYAFDVERTAGGAFRILGEYTSIETNSLLEFTMGYEGLPKAPPTPSDVSIQFHATESGTEIRFRQSFSEPPPNMDKRTESWEAMFDRLAKL